MSYDLDIDFEPFAGAHPALAPFWEAAREQRLIVPVCIRCGQAHWYPRSLCPHCSGVVEWRETPGTGEVYSYSVLRRAKAPSALSYVRLDGGPALMTTILECPFEAIYIGMRVEVVFATTRDGYPVPCFRPAAL